MKQVATNSTTQTLCGLAQVQSLEQLGQKSLLVIGDDFHYSGWIDFVIRNHGTVRLENNAGNVLILNPGKTVCTIEWMLHLGESNQSCGQIITASETKKYSVYVGGKMIFNHLGMVPMPTTLR